MRVSKCLGLLAALLVLGGPALAEAQYVYVANPEMAQILRVDPAGNDVVLFDDKKLPIGDLALSAEGMLYACVPAEGLIFAFDPTLGVEPLDLDDVTVVYEYDPNVDGPESPQCGWFTKDGGLLVNDTLGDGTWLINVSDGTATRVLMGFAGQGVTQAGNGALLVADSTIGQVTSTPVDLLTSDFKPSFTAPLVGAPNPIGVARSSGDAVYVATGNLLWGYYYDRIDHSWDLDCPLPFGTETPQFLEFTTDDTLYVASTSADVATLWSVDTDPLSPAFCTKSPIKSWIKDKGYKPALSGVAVEMGSVLAKEVPPYNDGYFFLNFYDHALEIEGSTDCTFTATAYEYPPSYVQTLIDRTLIDPFDPDCADPPVFDDGICAYVEGDPIIALGAGGYAFAYDVSKTGCGEQDHPTAINAYTGYVPNPRIGICTGTCAAPTSCSLLELYSYFPYNGLFPDDGRISSSTRNYSCLFLLDADLNEYAGLNTGDGRWCGFTPPMNQPTGYEYDPRFPDPEILDNAGFVAALPTFSTTETVPFKFRIADLEVDGNCVDGPFNANALVMFAIARVGYYDGDDNLVKVFEPMEAYPANSTDPVAPAYFDDPASPGQYYHFNAKFPGYEAGIYQLVSVALTNNFNAVVVYFKVQP